MTAPTEEWLWPFETEADERAAVELARAFARCFAHAEGAMVVEHLRRVFLQRRVSPTQSDAELRHVEGQRTVVDHILSMVDRGRVPCADQDDP